MQKFFALTEAYLGNVIVIIISLLLIFAIKFLTSRFESISKHYKAPYSYVILFVKELMRWLRYFLILIIVLEIVLICLGNNLSK